MRVSLEMMNDMTYTGSRAFTLDPDNARGTKVFVEGILLSEVRKIVYTPGKHTVVTLNWIPEDAGQNFLIDLFLDQAAAGLEINLPSNRGHIIFRTRIDDLNIALPKNDVASMYVTFKHVDSADPADDGPEIEVIGRETAIAVCEPIFEKWKSSGMLFWKEPIESIDTWNESGMSRLIRDLCSVDVPPSDGHSYHYTPECRYPMTDVPCTVEPAGGGFTVVHPSCKEDEHPTQAKES